MKLPLTGIVPPMITPLLDRDTLDRAGLEKLIEHILAGGVSGLFILGTTGEGPSLSYRLRRELVQSVCAQVRQRVPVLVGITDTAFVESAGVARVAADAGADAVVLAVRHSPYLALTPPEVLDMTGRPVAIIDCFGILADDQIRIYFEHGCEVKGLGRGHIQRIKEKVRKSR